MTCNIASGCHFQNYMLNAVFFWFLLGLYIYCPFMVSSVALLDLACFCRTLTAMHNFLFADPVDNMKDLLNQITSKEMSTAKRMGYVNNFTKVMYSTCKNLSMFASLHLLLQTGNF